MTKLEDLINSLATVIVRYHDTQRGVTPLVVELDPILLKKRSRIYASDIIKMDVKFDEKLTSIIIACTKGYPERKHFLTFLLNEITFLKTQRNRKESFTPEQLEKFQQQVNQFLIDCKQLLKTLKDKVYKVTYSSIEIEGRSRVDLNGLINNAYLNAYLGNHFCNSGLILRDEVLGRFNLTEDSSDEEISEHASSLCMEHQNALLVSELKAQKLELKSQKATLELTVSELEGDKSALALLNSGLENQKNTLELQISELEREKSTLALQKSELEEQKFTLERHKSSLEAEKSTLTIQTLRLTEKNQIQETTIEGLRHNRDKAQEELRRNFEKQQKELHKTQSEFERFKKQKIETHQMQEQTIEELRYDLRSTQTEVQKSQSELERIKKQKIETHQAQEQTIEELRCELRDTQEELQKTQSEFESFKKQKAEEPSQLPKRTPPIFPLYNGLAPFYLLNQQKGKGTFFQPQISTDTVDKIDEVTSRPSNRDK